MTIRRGPPERGGQYKNIQGLSRGLAILRALNQMPGGGGTVSALANATGLHRTTVKRLLETLRGERLIHREGDSSIYTLTFEVRRLAEGYGNSDWIDRISVPLALAKLPKMLWPSDIATPEAGFMVVRESTHRSSILSQHRAMIGTRLPMPMTAMGRAYLAWCSDDEREANIGLLAARDDALGDMARDKRLMARLVSSTRKRGYARNDGEWVPEAEFAAIALPIFGFGRIAAVINMVYPKNALSWPEVERRFVPLLRELVGEIEADLAKAGRSSWSRPTIAGEPPLRR